MKAGAAIDQAAAGGVTPLFFYGPVVDQANADGATPLFIAAHYGHSAVVEALVKPGPPSTKPRPAVRPRCSSLPIEAISRWR